MSTSFTNGEHPNAQDEAQIAVLLREFWQPLSDIGTESIWSNIEAAIQPSRAGVGFFSIRSLKRLIEPGRARYAATTAAIVISIVSFSLLSGGGF